jgi:hypothetical protein
VRGVIDFRIRNAVRQMWDAVGGARCEVSTQASSERRDGNNKRNEGGRI